jgi:transcriptional regulator with XRE-family HTH domain
LNLVQSAIEGYLRQGYSQTELAKRLKVSTPIINATLHGKKEPVPKLLNALGIERHVVYVFSDKLTRPSFKPKDRPKKPLASKPKQVDIDEVIEPGKKLKDLPKPKPITPEQVNIALRFGLNPGAAWSSFWYESLTAGEMWEHDFESWCASHGQANQKPANEAKSTVFASLGNGDAVPLKPQPQRNDFRAPLQPGQLRIIPTDRVPEALMPQTAQDQ